MAPPLPLRWGHDNPKGDTETMAITATDKRTVRFNFLLDGEHYAESQTVSCPADWPAKDIAAHISRHAETDADSWIPEARSILFYLGSETPEHVEITLRGFRDPAAATADMKADIERRALRKEIQILERRSDDLVAESDGLLREAEAFDADQPGAKSIARRSDILARFNDWRERMWASNQEIRAAQLRLDLLNLGDGHRSSSPDAPLSALSQLQDIAGSLRDLARPEHKTVSVERGPNGFITGLSVDEA